MRLITIMTAFTDQIPPHNLDAEQAVLGSILIEPSKLRLVRELLSPNDFYREAHRLIFETMCVMADGQVAIDLTTLLDALRKQPAPAYALDPRQNFSEYSSALLYLQNLMEAPATAENVDHYAQIVREKAALRQVIAQASEATELAYQGDMSRLLAGNGHFNLSALITSAATPFSNPFALNLMRASDLPAAIEPVRLWFGLYPRSVVLLIGESGAGKSSLLYNLCIHAARNEPLWSHHFGLGRPLRVLYIDPENSGNFAEGQGGQCSVKVERIGQGKPKDLYFHPGTGVNLADASHLAALQAFIEHHKIDLVIIDPIANLFATKDENDNAEAARQMTALTALSRAIGACVVAVHHTGKDSTSNYGRGASARLAAADVGIMFRARGDDEEEDDTFTGELKQRNDVCRLQIVKNRIEGRGSLYLAMTGEDKFELSTFQDWKNARKAGSEISKAVLAEQEIEIFLADGNWHNRSEILQKMSQEGIGNNNTSSALEVLEGDGIITSQKLKGKGSPLQYILTQSLQSAQPTDTDPSISSFNLDSKEIKLKEEMENTAETRVNEFFDEPSQEDEREDDDEGGWK